VGIASSSQFKKLTIKKYIR